MNTQNATKFLDRFQISDRSVWNSNEIEFPLECLLEDYHQEQLNLMRKTINRDKIACTKCYDRGCVFWL